ncbi:alpha/beta hydrolase [Streptomyces sp. NPDC057908]|uniref:alpha/beta hydrolase n=1 Tax=Streptomyces sp. NPDC057908 TaxID=3346276 RepID=UPI0036E52238
MSSHPRRNRLRRGLLAAPHVMADPVRRFLSFDGRDGGRGVEIFGDLSHAERIAVPVPGAGIGVDRYWRLRNGVFALHSELGERSAIVAWLGYETPTTVNPTSATSGQADEAAPELRDLIGELIGLKPAVRTSLVCHSYGSVVRARAGHGLRVADIVLCGSPGTGYGSAADLHTPATVRADRGSDDWIADVPHMKLQLPFVEVGSATDPVSPESGAEIFAAGDGGHRDDYLKPGSSPLKNIARIVAGTAMSAEPSGERHA